MATIIKSNKCDPARQLSQDRVLLSVVVPCFNEQEVIERTYTELVRSLGYLEGIALQIVIVDDGSTDRTGEIVKDLMTKDERSSLCASHAISATRLRSWPDSRIQLVTSSQ